jgi:hypothetical protein
MYLRALRGLLEYVPQARSLAQEYSDGRASARSALISKQAAIEEYFETLAVLDRELGSALRTTERFNLLRESWRFIVDRTLHVETSNVDYLQRSSGGLMVERIAAVGEPAGGVR